MHLTDHLCPESTSELQSQHFTHRFAITAATKPTADVSAAEILFSVLLCNMLCNPCVFKSTFYLCQRSTMESRGIALSIYHRAETAHPHNCMKMQGVGFALFKLVIWRIQASIKDRNCSHSLNGEKKDIVTWQVTSFMLLCSPGACSVRATAHIIITFRGHFTQKNIIISWFMHYWNEKKSIQNIFGKESLVQQTNVVSLHEAINNMGKINTTLSPLVCILDQRQNYWWPPIDSLFQPLCPGAFETED